MLTPELLRYKLKNGEKFFLGIANTFLYALKYFMLFVIFIVAVSYIIISSKGSATSFLLVKYIMKGFYILLFVFMVTSIIALLFYLMRNYIEQELQAKKIFSEKVNEKVNEILKRNGKQKRTPRKSR